MLPTPYERNLFANTLATLSPDFAALVEKLCPRPPSGTETRGLFECAGRLAKLRRQRKLDSELGIN